MKILDYFSVSLRHCGGCLVDRVALLDSRPFVGEPARVHPLDRTAKTDWSGAAYLVRTRLRTAPR